jgi:hypothetical protein
VEALRSPCSGNTREAEEPAPTKMPSNQRRRLRKGLFSPLSSAASEDFTPLSSENESSSHPPAALTSSHAPGASAHGAAASVAADSSHNDSEEEDESSRARSPTARPSFHLPASLSQGAASSHSKEEESSSPPSPPPLAPYHAPTASVDRATALFSSPSPSNPSEEEEASSTPQPSLNGAAAASATAIALHPVSNGEGSLLALSSEEASSSDPDGEEPSSSPSVLPLASHAPASFAHAAAASAAANSSEPEPEEEEDEESSLPSNSPVPSRAPMTTPRTSTQPDVSDQESSRAPSPAISARLAAAARSSSGAAAASFQPIPQQSPAKPKVLEKTSVLKDHVPIYTGTFRFENPVNLDNPAMPASNITLKIPRFLKIYRERSDKPGYDKITDLNTLATELSKLGWHTQKDKVLFLLTLPDLGEQLVRSALASKETKKYPNMLFPAGNSWVIDKEKMKFFVPNTRTSRKILLTNIFCKKNERSIQFSFFFDQDFNVWTSFAVWQRGVHPLETFPDLSPALTRIIKSSHSPAGFCSLLTGEVSFDYPLQDLINQKSTVFQQNAQRCSPSWTSLIEEEWSGAEVDDICRLLSEQEPWKRLKDLLLRKMNDAGQPHDQPWDVSQCRVIWTQKKPKIFFLKDSSGRKTILIRNVFFMKEPRLVQYCFLLTPIAGGKTFQVRALHTVWARSAHPIDALSLFPMGSTANLHEAASAESDV